MLLVIFFEGDSVVVASQAKRKVASHVMASSASVPKRNQSLKFVKGNTGRSYRERKRKGMGIALNL